MDRSLKLPDVRCGVGRFLFIGSKVRTGCRSIEFAEPRRRKKRFPVSAGRAAKGRPFPWTFRRKDGTFSRCGTIRKPMPDIPAEGEGISKKPPKPGNERRTAKAGRSAENRPVRQHAPRPRHGAKQTGRTGKERKRRRHSSLAGGNSGPSVGKTQGGRRPFPILKMPFPGSEGSEPTAGKRPRRRRGSCPRQIFPRKTRGTRPSFPQFLLLG